MDKIRFSLTEDGGQEFKPPLACEELQRGSGEPVEWLPGPSLSYRIIKRLIDIIGSLILLVACAPLFLAIMLAVKLTSRGPAVFRQTRVGYRGKRFTFLKFRSMYMNLDRKMHKEYVTHLISGKYGPVGEQGVYKLANDSRLTPVGRFLRRTSLDELPQFWNVLHGDMSLVGPRPPIPYELALYQPWQVQQLLSVKPGITGIWQIEGRSKTAFEEMVKLNIEYVKHPSILLDLRILFTTPIAVIRADKAF